jgi:hypothetical protein
MAQVRRDMMLCYAEEDSSVAVEIAQGLEAVGYSTWYSWQGWRHLAFARHVHRISVVQFLELR